MSLEKLTPVLAAQLADLKTAGTLKGAEKITVAIRPAAGIFGPRYLLEGQGDREFLKMNGNSYLGLSEHPEVIRAEEEASRLFGAGPGAVRFISGTFAPHVALEKMLARFHGREAAMIFSAAYATVMGILPQLIDRDTMVLSDALNHNCIINAVRLARPAAKGIYRHLDMAELEVQLENSIDKGKRVIVVTDGVFSMRGDFVRLDEISAICARYQGRYEQGVILVVDDSHGIGAFGRTGRGTEEYTAGRADILVGTLGKALGVNGGYLVSTRVMIDYLRETSPFYIYSNPITPAEAAAAMKSLEILDSPEGIARLDKIRALTKRFEDGLVGLGYEIIAGENPIVPLMVRDTRQTSELVDFLFANNILATGLNFPVVPKGDEEIRFQISASHTDADIDYVLAVLDRFKQIC